MKIGKANSKTKAQFTSQHYGFSARSTLAKSICSGNKFISMGITPGNIKEWMMANLHRIIAIQGIPVAENQPEQSDGRISEKASAVPRGSKGSGRFSACEESP